VSAPQDPRAAAHSYLDRGLTPIPWVIRDGPECAAISGFSYRDYTIDAYWLP
jgi:hypothetical protein